MDPEISADTTLLCGLRAGKRGAFDELYARYHAPIYNLCARLLGDRDEAQDLTQEVFLKAFSALPGGEVRALRPWLYRVATNSCLNHLRSRGRTDAAATEVEEVPSNVDGFEQSQTVTCVEETLTQLNERYRVALLLKDLHGFSTAEIASVLELPRGSADVLVHRARSAFRRTFAELAGKTPAPARLGLVLAPLAVPAALHAMPPLPMPLIPHALGPALSAGGSGALLAKLSSSLGLKLAVAGAAAALLAGGGIAADQLLTPASHHGGQSSPRAAATAPAVIWSSLVYKPGSSQTLVEHWLDRCSASGASCGDQAGGATHDLHDGTEHAGETHNAATTAHEGSETTHHDATETTTTTATHETHTSVSTGSALEADHSVSSGTATGHADSHDGLASSHDGGSE